MEGRLGSRHWCRALLACGLLIGASPVAADSADDGRVISADTRAAVAEVLEALRAERRRKDPAADLGRAIREIRLRLRELSIGAPTRGTAAELDLVQQAADRANDLLARLKSDPSASDGELERLGQVEHRLAELSERTAAIRDSASQADRAQRARELVRDLEATFPRDERVDPGPRRQPVFIFLAPNEPRSR